MSERKYCVDCQFYKFHQGFPPKCMRYSWEVREEDLVFGERKEIHMNDCREERKPDGMCKPDGIGWEKKRQAQELSTKPPFILMRKSWWSGA